MADVMTNVDYYRKQFAVNGLSVNQAIENYRRAVRASVRGLWAGVIDLDDFVDSMFAAIDLFIPQAWREGAAEVGVAPNELTDRERIAIRQMIQGEREHVFSFGLWIEQHSKATGGKLGTVFARSESWILRAQDARNNGILSAKNDPKLMWVYDPAKENCRTCAKLNGKVKRKSFWERIGVKPQNAPNPQLECGGWQCGCRFVPTDAPLSRGRLPGLP